MKKKWATIEEPIVIEHVPEGNEEPKGEKVVEEVPKALKPIPRPPSLFPQRLAKKADDDKFLKFIEKLKQLSINIPLVEALEQMPGSIVTKALVQKKEDPGAFTIPCTIGMYKFGKVVCDLGASINLMRLAIFNKLADFVILDYEFDFEMPIILERPFLATGRALVDVERGDLKFKMNDEVITFHICKSMKQPTDMSVVSVINTIDESMEITIEHEHVGEMLAAVLMNYEGENKEEFEKTVNALVGLGTYKYNPKKLDLDIENREKPPVKPSIIEPPTLELKPLTSYLRYEFVGLNNTLP
ncbi:uncharacterized protein LOC132061447 [Lycium ferocissimum]|uniref:uncharacterized protein LOC132061447 n=1 Tax=Lycium ferocissimum TaxID=112874 RepID=UPI002815F6EA|nr:uncharacterized protein LOC132061447 [Lycium ferocissimum]